jgi:transcriptional regulator with XRE-family HTH domain
LLDFTTPILRYAQRKAAGEPEQEDSMRDCMIMLGEYRQAHLEAAKVAFFASGGRVDVIETNFYEPRPARTEAPVSSPALVFRSGNWSRMRELAKTMSKDQTALATGLTRRQLTQLEKDGGFTFRLTPSEIRMAEGVKQRLAAVEAAKERRDRLLAERITALRAIGLTSRQIARQMKVSESGLNKIMQRTGINSAAQKAGK